jgi:hypothetical protein
MRVPMYISLRDEDGRVVCIIENDPPGNVRVSNPAFEHVKTMYLASNLHRVTPEDGDLWLRVLAGRRFGQLGAFLEGDTGGRPRRHDRGADID